MRNISAPMPRLKRAQEWILFNILENVELHQAAHGFRRGRSIVTNAQPHVDHQVVVNVDLQDFFPTVTYKRIWGVFRSFGFSHQVATILSLICSEPDVAEVELDSKTYFVAQSERFLPQGAPSSPAITNIICRGLDQRIDHSAVALGFTYTRYADDMTLSGSDEAVGNIGTILRRVKYVVEDEGFCINEKKTRVLRSARRQEVTGLVVNDRVGVPRATLRRFRATLFQIEKDGPAGKQWGNSTNILESIEGYANFVAMVAAEKGGEYQRRVAAIISKFGRAQPQRPIRQQWKKAEPETEPASTQQKQPDVPQPEKKRKPWWKFW